MISLTSIPVDVFKKVLAEFLVLDDLINLTKIQHQDFQGFIDLVLNGSCLTECGRILNESDLGWMHDHSLSSETIFLKCYVNTIIVSKLTRMWSTLRHLRIFS